MTGTAASSPSLRKGLRDAAGRAKRRILALDYGRKRIGLALSDELQLTARPLKTLERKNRSGDFRRLREICREQGVMHIIVGHPVDMTGSSGPMAEEAARFAARLKKELGIDVELVDERLTSWEAEQAAASGQLSRGRGHRELDDVAAAILLREYLAHRPRMRSDVAEEG